MEEQEAGGVVGRCLARPEATAVGAAAAAAAAVKADELAREL